jgi:probable F420-dependent oxidoreductase
MSYSLAMYGADPLHQLAVSQRAEALGFDGVWFGEHVLAPLAYRSPSPHQPSGAPPVVPLDLPLSDIWVLLGAVLGSTSRIFFGSGIYILPLRHPLLTARAAITAQQLSNGRLRLGIGAGWLAEEFAALDQQFDNRMARLEEIVEILRKAWAGGPVEHHGRFYSFEPVQLTDRPLEVVPLVFGSTAERGLRRAARLGDGWYNPGNASLEDCLAVREKVERLRAEYGRQDRPFHYYVRVNIRSQPHDAARYRQAGFDDLVIPWQIVWSETEPTTLEQKLTSLERVAEALDITAPAAGRQD